MLRDRHPQRGAGEQVQAANTPRAEPRESAESNPPGNGRGWKGARVEQHEAGKPRRPCQGRSQADRTAPVVRHQRDVGEIQCVDQSNEIVDVVLQRVWVACGLSLRPQPM